MRKIKILFFYLVGFYFILPAQSWAETFILGFQDYDPQISSYHETAIRIALDHLPEKHELVVKRLDVSQDRIFRLLEDENSIIDFSMGGYSRDKEQRFLQLDIPLARGTLGYRIFAIRKESHAAFQSIKTLNDLRDNIVVGSGLGWPDTRIFRANGFRVEAANYNSLWLMLSKGRYDAFNRGIGEAYLEVQNYEAILPNLSVDSSLMVHYPYGSFLYFNKSKQVKHDLLLKGFKAAYESGAFMENFNSHPQIKKVFEVAKPENRKSFELINPEISDRIKAIPAKYWHKF